jgi:signal transduction histidine kinase
MNLAELLATVTESVRIREQNAPGASPMIWKVQIPAAGVWGQWDKSRLEQVLANLLDNAVKYSPAGAEIEVGLEVDGENAHAWIADQGIGIPPEERTKIFQPFFRATNVSSGGRTLPGLGLGLSICREIMDLHEGRIWVESPGPKKGSVFHISLPGAVSGPVAAPNAARESRVS